MHGKLIVIEGTDCSGKETQSKLIIERLKKEGVLINYFSFPNYDSPTGKIVGGPYLGKEFICKGWFNETAPNVDPMVSSLYYAADRKYNIGYINELLEKGENVILDRYLYSNMAHQGGKLNDENERIKMYKWIEKLEIDLLELPVPDIKIFLHVPYEIASILKKNRGEWLDENEANKDHLINAERAFLEIANLYDFKKIECCNNDTMMTISEINDKIYEYLKLELNK